MNINKSNHPVLPMSCNRLTATDMEGSSVINQKNRVINPKIHCGSIYSMPPHKKRVITKFTKKNVQYSWREDLPLYLKLSLKTFKYNFII